MVARTRLGKTNGPNWRGLALCGLSLAAGFGCDTFADPPPCADCPSSPDFVGGKHPTPSGKGGGPSLLPAGGTAQLVTGGTGGTVAAGGMATGGTSPGGSVAGTGQPDAGSGNFGGDDNGGAGGSAEPDLPSVCDGKTAVLEASAGYLDNFETSVRFASWFSFSDTVPPNQPAIARVAGGALQTAFAAHVSASDILSRQNQGYGAGFGFTPADLIDHACLSVAAFDGISFWARGSAGTDSALTVQVVVPASQPHDAIPAGDCLSDCYLHPRHVITLGADWYHYVLPFSTFVAPQAGWADRNILGLLWLSDGPDYDVAIDEVAFYAGSAPTGPVSPSTDGAGGEGGGGGAAP